MVKVKAKRHYNKSFSIKAGTFVLFGLMLLLMCIIRALYLRT